MFPQDSDTSTAVVLRTLADIALAPTDLAEQVLSRAAHGAMEVVLQPDGHMQLGGPQRVAGALAAIFLAAVADFESGAASSAGPKQGSLFSAWRLALAILKHYKSKPERERLGLVSSRICRQFWGAMTACMKVRRAVVACIARHQRTYMLSVRMCMCSVWNKTIPQTFFTNMHRRHHDSVTM